MQPQRLLANQSSPTPTERVKMHQNETFRIFMTIIKRKIQIEKAAEAEDELEDIAAYILAAEDVLNDDGNDLPTPSVRMHSMKSEENGETFFALTRGSSFLHVLSVDLLKVHKYNEKTISDFSSILDAPASSVEGTHSTTNTAAQSVNPK